MAELSVILATHNRRDFARACLESLCAQTASPDRFDICVVANACSDDTAAMARAFAASHPPPSIMVVEEPVAGLSRARNAGIRATTSPLLANIDDDSTAAPDWVDVILARFANLPADVAMIGGEIDPVWMAPPPPWLTPGMMGILSAASNMGTTPRLIDGHEGLFEGNGAYRRQAIEAIGLYPLGLGRAGNSLLSGEGVVLDLLRSKGWGLYFDPALRIRHTIHANRLHPLWFRHRHFWQGISAVAMRRAQDQHQMARADAITIELPLDAADWAFIAQDSTANLTQSLLHFESLGFALATSGIIPVEGG